MNPFLMRFFARRGLEGPIGCALHAYRATDVELADATRLLNVSLEAGWRGSSAAAMFCLVTAEWFRARYQGGPWSWREIQRVLAVTDQNLCRSLALDGLTWWGRPVTRQGERNQYVLSLAAEGGLPTVLLSNQGAAVRRFLEQVGHDIADYRLDAPEAVAVFAAHHEHLMPQAFRNEAVRRVVAELALWLTRARASIPEEARDADPLPWIERHAPSLLAEAPLQLDDAAARSLLTTELRAAPGRSKLGSSALAARVLIRGELGWRPAIAVSASVNIDAQGPHAGMLAALGQTASGRLRPSGSLRAAAAHLVIGIGRTPEGDWSATRRSGDEVAGPLALDQQAQVELFADGRMLGEFELCPPVDAQDLALWRDQAPDGEAPQRLDMIAGRMVQTRRARLYLSAPFGARLEVTEDVTLEPLAEPPDGASLWKVVGSGVIRCGDSSVKILTSAEREAASLAWLANPMLMGAALMRGGPIYRGAPRVRIGEIGAPSCPAQPSALRWRPLSGGPWRDWRESAPVLGEIEIRVVSNEGTVASLRAGVVPETARIARRADPDDAARIELSGFGAEAQVVAETSGTRTVEAMRQGDASLRLVGGDEGGLITLSVIPDAPTMALLRLSLSRPVRRPGFIAPDGARARNDATLSTTGLPGWRAVAPTGCAASLRVRVRDHAGVERLFYRSFTEARSLSDLRDTVEAAIAAAGPDAEANMRVLADGAESPRLIVRRYDGALRRMADDQIGVDAPMLAALNSSGLAEVTLEALNLMAPTIAAPLGVWRPGDAPARAVSSLAAIDGGPWLIVARVGGGLAFRPCATWFSGAPVASAPRFSAAYADASSAGARTARIQKLAMALSDTMSAPLSDDWPMIEAMLDAAAGLQVTASLDLTQALASAPSALCVLALRAAQDRLTARLDLDRAAPLFWPTVQVSDWMRGMARYGEDLRTRLASALSAQEAADLTSSQILRAAKAIVAMRPELAGHLAFASLDNGLPLLTVAQAFPAVAQGEPSQTLLALMAETVARNGEFAEAYDGPSPPPGSAAALVAHFDPRWAALLAAPLVAGAAAVGVSVSPRDAFALRALQASDPVYFDAATPLAVRLARETR